MALVLAAFLIQGLTPGRKMLGAERPTTYMLMWGLMIANVVGAGICLLFYALSGEAPQGDAAFSRSVDPFRHLPGCLPGIPKLRRHLAPDGGRSGLVFPKGDRLAQAPTDPGVLLGLTIEQYLVISLELYV
jgi:hypothetical protein